MTHGEFLAEKLLRRISDQLGGSVFGRCHEREIGVEALRSTIIDRFEDPLKCLFRYLPLSLQSDLRLGKSMKTQGFHVDFQFGAAGEIAVGKGRIAIAVCQTSLSCLLADGQPL